MSKRQIHILTSPLFTVSVCLLLANDFIFKPYFHNWLTGKLSDFAGLFVFPIFWTAFFPQRKKVIYSVTAFFFIFWKSVYSQPFINAWNDLSILPVSRVVDATDLFALFVLPLSFIYTEYKDNKEVSFRFAPYAMAIVSLFAFTATSYSTKFDYDNKFYFLNSQIELTRKLYHLGHLNSELRVSPSSNPNDIGLEIPSDFCFNRVDARIGISEEQGQSIINLKEMAHGCPEGKNDKQKMLDIFEEKLIAKLTQVSINSPNLEARNSAPSTKSELNGTGQIYFLPIGETPQINVEKVANQFRRKYGIAIKVLPVIPLTDEVRSPNYPNSRPIAERLIEVIKERNPKIASNPKAFVIGITQDMNVSMSNRMYNFSYQTEERFAVIAIDSMNPTTFGEPENQELLESRVNKVFAKNIGILYFGLPISENPKSVMYSSLNCVDELDGMSEEF